jgi:hypothetical protein
MPHRELYRLGGHCGAPILSTPRMSCIASEPHVGYKICLGRNGKAVVRPQCEKPLVIPSFNPTVEGAIKFGAGLFHKRIVLKNISH